MRTPIIAGNWKMNNTTAAGKALVTELAALVADVKDRQIVVCVPFTILGAMKEALQGTNIALGAQNLHWEKSGAYTGEISADMLLDMGVEYVLIGHSERRQYFAETDETVNKKVLTAFANGIVPILCVGETLEEREGGIMEQVINTQVEKALVGLTGEQIKQLVIIRTCMGDRYGPYGNCRSGKRSLRAHPPQSGRTFLRRMRKRNAYSIRRQCKS